MSKEMELISQADADIICWQDIGSTTPAWNQALKIIKERMQDKYMEAKYAKSPTGAHGTAILIKDKWARKIVDWVNDPRGWGRWVGIVIQTSNQSDSSPKQLIVVSVYLPCQSGKEIKEQSKHLQTKSREASYLKTLQELWEIIQPKITPETTVVFSGDMNVHWNPRNTQRRQQIINEDPKKQRRAGLLH